jgi:ribonuclease BN (tRNA processing enzyme)
MGPVRPADSTVTVTFAGSGDAFGRGGRFQACIHLQGPAGTAPVLLDCGATSLTALRRCGCDPGEIAAVFVSHLHGDHFGGLPFLILDGQFSGRVTPLTVAGPAYTGDTAWTEALTEVAGGADLLIAEAYYRDKAIPYHLRHADLVAHQARLASRRIVLTHMSADMLAHPEKVGFDTAHDGYVVRI